MFLSNNSYIDRFYFNDSIEIKHFLKNLEIDTVYVATLEFVYSEMLIDEEDPIILLSKPILITKNSNPTVISKFIIEKIRLVCDIYFLEDEILTCKQGNKDGPGVIIKYSKINLF
jgi:hypothetical protein